MNLPRALVAAHEERFGLRPPESRRALDAIAQSAPDAELAPLVANHHTWFLRDRAQLEELAQGLSDRAPSRSPVHVWCAGSSTGEEAYSLALLLEGRGVDARIVASDVVPGGRERARAARYEALTLRHVDALTHARLFEQATASGGARVRAALRERVTFVQHNLVDAPLTAPDGGWDAIVCRNVLIHWTPRQARALVPRLRGALAAAGTLVLGAADALVVTPRSAEPSRASTPPAAPEPMTAKSIVSPSR